jgi:hypothetical protein
LSPNDSNLSVFTDYEITDDKDAAAAIEQLQRNLSASFLVISSAMPIVRHAAPVVAKAK